MNKKILTEEESSKLFGEAFTLWEEGKSEQAFHLFMQIADKGDRSSFVNIGYMYDVGEGVERNIDLAFYWYKKAWRQDKSRAACSNIALLYKELKDYKKAIYWWEKSVKNDDGDTALDYAKFLLEHRPKKINKVLDLLEFCVKCKPRFNISEAGLEEAQQLLEETKNRQPKRYSQEV